MDGPMEPALGHAGNLPDRGLAFWPEGWCLKWLERVGGTLSEERSAWLFCNRRPQITGLISACRPRTPGGDSSPKLLRHGKSAYRKKHTFLFFFLSFFKQNYNLTQIQVVKKILKTQFRKVFSRLKTDVAKHFRIFWERRWGGRDWKWLVRHFWARPPRCCAQKAEPVNTFWKEATPRLPF